MVDPPPGAAAPSRALSAAPATRRPTNQPLTNSILFVPKGTREGGQPSLAAGAVPKGTPEMCAETGGARVRAGPQAKGAAGGGGGLPAPAG